MTNETQKTTKPTRVHLTDKLVKDLPIPNAGYKITYDDELRGFGIQISCKGRRTFIINYSIHGRERRYKIGEYGTAGWSMAAARDRAKELRRKIDMHIDPQGQKDEEKAAPTLKWLYQEYEKIHLPTLRPHSQQNIKAMWRDFIFPKLGNMRLKDLGAKDIDELHRYITSLGTRTRANRVIENLRSVLNKGVRWGKIDKNPAAGFERNPEEAREVYLTKDQVKTVLEILKSMKNQQAANVIRMLLLTGARLREVTRAEWSQFNFENGLWVKPSSHTKQKRRHELPLSSALIALLRQMKKESKSSYLFPSKKTGEPIHDIQKPWKWLKKTANLGDDIRIHDLRHTVASLLISENETLPVIGKILGHTQSKTTERYAHLIRERTQQGVDTLSNLMDMEKHMGGDLCSPKTYDEKNENFSNLAANIPK